MCLNSRIEASSLEPAFLLVTLMVNSPAASSGIQEMGPASQLEAEKTEGKYDNFYSPYNRDFYESFKYETLRPCDRRIRLLRIHPHEANEDDTATVKCDLIDDVSLEEYRRNFTTISYCAGDPKKAKTVLVNGEPFNAFANLDHALRQARHFWKISHPDHELLLWADQICINQSDTPERSHQVGFMGDIYAAAQQVLICLSTAEDRGGGFTWLKQYARDMFTHFKLGDTGVASNGPRSTDEDLLSGYQSYKSSITRSRWWSRAWVRQEFIRSADAYFLASYEFLDFRSFEEVLSGMRILLFRGLNDHEEHRDTPSESCQVCVVGADLEKTGRLLSNMLSLLRVKIEVDSSSSTYPNLLNNLANLSYLDASDPKDLIYACLGYSSHSYGLEPDYTAETTFFDVSCQLARKVVEYNDNLDVLYLAQTNHLPSSREPNKETEFPSWVPVWRSRYYSFSDLGGKAQARQHVSFHSDDKGRSNRILHARGVLLSENNTLISSVHREGMRRYENGHELNESDEVWLLQGAHHIFVFKPKGQYHELVDVASKIYENWDIPNEWIDEVAKLVEENHPAVQTILIC